RWVRFGQEARSCGKDVILPAIKKVEGERMKRLLAVALVLFAVPLFADGSKKPRIIKAKRKIPNAYIVVLEDRVDVDAAASDLAGLSRGQLKHVYKSALKGFALDVSDAEAAAIAQD